MSDPVDVLRCVGCCRDISIQASGAKCPHCGRLLVDSLRRWQRFVERDVATVRGALLTIAIATAVTIPCALAATILGGFVDVGAMQRNPFASLQSPLTLLMMLAGCIMLPAQLSMLIAWLLILFFAFGGVLYRMIAPLATFAVALVGMMGVSMLVGIASGVFNRGSDVEEQTKFVTTMTMGSTIILSLMLYIMVAWAIDALFSSFLPKLPRRLMWWSIVLVLAIVGAGVTALNAVNREPAFSSPVGLLRVIANCVAYTGFSVIVIWCVVKARRIAAELAHRHSGIRMQLDPSIVRADAPPVWGREDQ
ncbi:MAG: hypothetical protein SGJ09_01870 [Phycisphaerae bacterium]|nr:hypothetical protein [Phycisphaerae bacterium]